MIQIASHKLGNKQLCGWPASIKPASSMFWPEDVKASETALDPKGKKQKPTRGSRKMVKGNVLWLRLVNKGHVMTSMGLWQGMEGGACWDQMSTLSFPPPSSMLLECTERLRHQPRAPARLPGGPRACQSSAAAAGSQGWGWRTVARHARCAGRPPSQSQ